MNEAPKRKHIPNEVRRILLLECGFRCSVPRCDAQWPMLHFHHIDENPSNNTAENLLVLCPTHHQMVTSKHIDKKNCELLKELLAAFSDVPAGDSAGERNRLLYTLASELLMNLGVLSDKKFTSEHSGLIIYPRLLHVVCDGALSSGLFIARQDGTLYKRLFGWAEVCRDFNRRLDLTETWRAPDPNSAMAKKLQQTLAKGRTIQSVRESCKALITHIIDHYGESCGIDYDTVFFEETEVDEDTNTGDG